MGGHLLVIFFELLLSFVGAKKIQVETGQVLHPDLNSITLLTL